MADESIPEVVAVRTGVSIDSRQKIPYFVGVSEATTGARGLSLQYVIIPPGTAAVPHILRDGHIRLIRPCGDNLWARVAQAVQVNFCTSRRTFHIKRVT